MDNINKIWLKKGRQFFHYPKADQVELLAQSVYRLDDDPNYGLHLTSISKNFKFDYKIYGKDDEFIERVLSTYMMMPENKNLGILMTGLKGTGKTVTAKQLCNKTNLPVILINTPHGGYREFINEIDQECVFLFDEFEKTFENNSNSILTLLDGTLETHGKKLFIFTTNTTYIDSNLLQRPTRIRYIKNFDNLEEEIVEQIIDDNLKSELVYLKKQTIDYLFSLEIITIDIVKSVVDEINMYEESPYEFHKLFNVDYAMFNSFDITFGKIEDDSSENIKISDTYHISELFPDGCNTSSTLSEYCSEDNNRLEKISNTSHYFHIEGVTIGKIVKNINQNNFIVSKLSPSDLKEIIYTLLDRSYGNPIKDLYSMGIAEGLKMLNTINDEKIRAIVKTIKILMDIDGDYLVTYKPNIKSKRKFKLVF